MDNFIFKVPTLLDDSLRKRKANNVSRSNNEIENRNGLFGERSNSLQASFYGRQKKFGIKELQTVREGVEEDLARPSTSRQVLQYSNNSVGSCHNTFTRYGNGSDSEVGFNGRRNLMNATVGENQRHCGFNTVSVPRMTHSALGGNVYGKGLNFSSLNSHHSSVFNSCFKNSFNDKSDMYKRMNSSLFFDPNQCTSESSVVEPSHSIISMKKSIFTSDSLPKKYRMSRDTTISERRNNFNSQMNSFNCTNSASIIPRDSNVTNTGQRLLDNQSLMKSVVKMSIISMKEEIMNRLEDFGHMLLRNSPSMESTFAEAAKDIKDIMEKSLIANPITDSNRMMSYISYSSGITGPQQSMFRVETNREHSEVRKKPIAALQEVLKQGNEKPKFELIKSFTVSHKKQNESYEDLSFDESMENINFASKGSKEEKVIKLKNWYPIIKKNTLAFSGINEENIQVETGIVKKRISNRILLLDNGVFCNLIGNPSIGKKFSSSISTKLKNGLPHSWKKLTTMIANFQKSSQKDNSEKLEEDVSTTTFQTSHDVTVLTRSTTKLLAIKVGDNRGREKEEENEKVKKKFVSPKAAKICDKSTKKLQNRAKKRVSDEIKNKTESNGKKRSRSPVEEHPIKMQKRDSTNNKTVEEDGNKDSFTERAWYTTKRGRVVTRPKKMWIGSTSIEMDTSKKPVKSIEAGVKEEEPTKTNQPVKSSKAKKVKQTAETKSVNARARKEPEAVHESPVATKAKAKTSRKVAARPVSNRNSNTYCGDNLWGNDIAGLDDIIVPNISIHHEETISDSKNLKLSTMETPPLKNIRNNLTFLKNCTPAQSPDWQTSRHTRSAVKKFEKLRAQAFKTKIPKENVTKTEKKSKNPVRGNKDVDTVLNWISEREVRSPKKCSNVVNYIMPKRNELEDEDEDSGNEVEEEEM